MMGGVTMDNQQIAHDLALIYAKSKLGEYLLDKRDGLACGATDTSEDEVEYLQDAYNFAIKNLN